MDRIVPRRRAILLALAILLSLGLVPATPGQAKRPNLSDMPAGDPGDGVLRPYESDPLPQDTEAQAATSPTTTPTAGPQYLLVPMPGPAGQPWPLVFRLVRIERAETFQPWRPFPTGGRWHRAP